MEQRLQKIIADAGITSRRKAEQIILEGRVSVNGKPVSKLGSKADPAHDHIRVDGRLLTRDAESVYLLVNKPVGYVSTVSDPQHRPTVVSLVRGIKQRVYPVGRLDFHSSGLMILTNDGELANFLMSRASAVPRSYQVKLEGRPDPADIAKLQTGIVLDGRRTEPCEIHPLGQDPKPWYEITLIEGRYHQVRRMFERVGKGVVKLKRVRIAFLTDKDLAPGNVRNLTRSEVERLKAWKETDTVALKSHEPRRRSLESAMRSQSPAVRIQPPAVKPQTPPVGRQYIGTVSPQPAALGRNSGFRPQTPTKTRPYPAPRPQGPGAGSQYRGARPERPTPGSQKFGSRPQGNGPKGKPFGGRPQRPETGSPYRGPRPQGTGAGSQYRGARPERPTPGSQKFGSRPQGNGPKGKPFGARPRKPGDRNQK